MQQQIFVISGLGVDERVFEEICFGNAAVHFLHWIPPILNETLSEYAVRMSQQIQSDSIILIGLSLGGMIAVEMSKVIKVQQLILIASAPTAKELPFILKACRVFPFHTLIPFSFFMKANLVNQFLFGVKKKEHKKLLDSILRETSLPFFKWALNAMIRWDNLNPPNDYVHIHGQIDQLIPLPSNHSIIVIPNAGHFMTATHSVELNTILSDKLKQ